MTASGETALRERRVAPERERGLAQFEGTLTGRLGRRPAGSLLPAVALHSLNNSLALAVGEDWTWQIPVVVVGSLAVVMLALTRSRGARHRASRRPPPSPSGAGAEVGAEVTWLQAGGRGCRAPQRGPEDEDRDHEESP